ncbi:uncharacterized protein LOC144553107 isoform X2 [Carex rostrata]
MAPSRKAKGKTPVGDEAKPSERNVRGPNAYVAPPSDPSRRPVLTIGGFRLFDAGDSKKTKQVAKIISQEVRTNYHGPYYRYTDFPKTSKEVIEAEFLRHYQFALGVSEKEAWDTFRKIADKRLADMLNKAKLQATRKYGDEMLSWKEHGAAPHPFHWIKSDYWPGLVDYWCSDAFATWSQRNASNRANAKSSGATTGSVNMLVHKRRFMQEHGREPRWSDELFQPTHTNKKTGEYISGKAKRAQDKYERARFKSMERTEAHGLHTTTTSGTLRALMIRILTAITMV